MGRPRVFAFWRGCSRAATLCVLFLHVAGQARAGRKEDRDTASRELTRTAGQEENIHAVKIREVDPFRFMM